ALAARGDRAHQHSVSNLVASNPRPKLFNDSHGFVSNNKARFDGVLASYDVEVSPTDRRQSNSNERLADCRVWFVYLFDVKVVYSSKNVGSHLFHFLSSQS